MKPDILALIDKAKDSLGAARDLIRDGYFDLWDVIYGTF
jgi:hypothetical protein